MFTQSFKHSCSSGEHVVPLGSNHAPPIRKTMFPRGVIPFGNNLHALPQGATMSNYVSNYKVVALFETFPMIDWKPI